MRRGDAHLEGGRQVAVAVGEDAGKIVLSRKRCLGVKILFKTTDRGLTKIIAGAVVVADGGHHRQVDIVVGGCLVKRIGHLFEHFYGEGVQLGGAVQGDEADVIASLQ